MKNKAGWVALIVLAVASLLMVFFVLPNIDKAKEAATVDTPAETPSKAANEKTEQPVAQGEAVESKVTPQATAEAAADPAVDPAVPGFDILRVEPDGSTVIAGRAQPNTKIEIVDGDTVVGTAQAGATGDFAAIFDKPLPAGDYQLTLRSVDASGAVKSSAEVATVSIPKENSGELLAMVSKPGEASRIITKPTSETMPTSETKPVAGTTSDDAASKQPAVTQGDSTKADRAPDATAKLPEVNGSDVAKPEETTASQKTPRIPAAGETPPASAGETPPVAVSAVEIEGRKIFVAGTAKPGSLVRIYANDQLVGEMKANDGGRFVVDGVIDLPVGSHTIRADVMSADGSKVEMRAAVPFDRPAGDQVAAVAEAGAQGAVAPFEGGSFDALRTEATKALGLLKALYADGKTPTVEELAAARSATEIALKSLADFKVADTLDAGVRDTAAATSRAAASALAMLKALPRDAASVSASLGRIEQAVGSALMPRTDGNGGNAVAGVPAEAVTPADKPAVAETALPAETAGEKPAAGSAGAVEAGQPQTQTAAQSSNQPQTVQQAPLKQSKTSVIIRRGDTLWRISRRVYGAGVRYTTIYLANEDQITNPDRILPGQVFGVPDEAMPEGESEQLHRKRLNHKS